MGGIALKRTFAVLVLSAMLFSAFIPAGSAAPNDPHFAKQWALSRIKAERAWGVSTGANVTIAFLDTGIDLYHEDLAARLVPGATIVKCGRTSCAKGRDDHGHGTHVAGIAAAVRGNAKGIAGVAPSARLMPVKVLDSNAEATTEDIARGIRYAVNKGVRILNLSVGYISGAGTVFKITGALDPIYEAIEYAWSKGAVVVASAGNYSAPLCTEPAAALKAICVGATDRNDLIASYSNSGDIDLTAPGGLGSLFCEQHSDDVLSTIWAGSDLDCQGRSGLKGYETFAGTSMAAPHVSGVAALILSRSPGLSGQKLVEKLYLSVDDLGPAGSDPIYGRGRINACKAVRRVC